MTPEQLSEHFAQKEIRDDRGHISYVREEVMKTTENAKAKLRGLLKEVHDRKSYRHDFKSFEDYCMKEWKITGARAYQIIKGEKFRLLLEGEGVENVAMIPEGQLRELAELPPAKAAKIFNKVKAQSDKTGKKFTAKDIAKAIDPTEVIPPKLCLCPSCGQPIKKKPSTSIPDRQSTDTPP